MEEQRLIFHIDVNSAFLSWTAVKRLQEDPSSVDLRTIPSAVGGDRKTRHGIITAKSIPARKYGVTTGEPVVKALQKCPNLVLVEGDFETYRKYSHAFIEILHRYAPVVEQVAAAWQRSAARKQVALDVRLLGVGAVDDTPDAALGADALDHVQRGRGPDGVEGVQVQRILHHQRDGAALLAPQRDHAEAAGHRFRDQLDLFLLHGGLDDEIAIGKAVDGIGGHDPCERRLARLFESGRPRLPQDLPARGQDGADLGGEDAVDSARALRSADDDEVSV